MRRFVLITAPNSSGKTSAARLLRGEARSFGADNIGERLISGFLDLIEAVRIDDEKRGGGNHVHEHTGHPHAASYTEETLDFIVTGQALVSDFRKFFWERTMLSEVDSMINLVEFSGGVNLGKYRQVDHSYAGLINLFNNGSLSTKGLTRISDVIYIDCDLQTRLRLNDRKVKTVGNGAVLSGEVSPVKPVEVILQYGKSDFYESRTPEFLENFGIRTHRVVNDGGAEGSQLFHEQIKTIAKEIFPRLIGENKNKTYKRLAKIS